VTTVPGILVLERLRAAPLRRKPFDFVVIEDFVAASAIPTLVAEFPAVGGHGSYPLDLTSCGPAFAALAAELEGEALRAAIEDKFGVDLAGRPTIITLRGYSDGKDGRIHTDSVTKIVTLLLYLNPEWREEGGRLRLLRGPDDIDDYAAEIAPQAGAMVAFRRSDRSFHGHRAHVGPRRVVQLNWVTDQRVADREMRRHDWSARLKALNPFA